ncbi:MAG: hypothetical protein H0V12_00860, partial [Chloroflexi bacterium]|nr:hypothetical protein [Chloroflexota bacterium]
MRQRLILAGWVALLAVACGSGIGGVTRSPEQRSPEGSTGTANMPSEAAATNAASPAVFETVPRCEQIERISAAPEWYRDSPIYVAN